jgi:GntR family transcriptional regulator
MYPNLEENDFDKESLYDVMRRTYGYKPTWGEAIVEAGAANYQEASYLELKTNIPVLIIWHLTLDDRFVPLEHVRSIYRSDRFSFSAGRNPMRIFNH